MSDPRSITTTAILRDELNAMLRRSRTSATTLAAAAGVSNTVAGFVNDPTRANIKLSTVMAVVVFAGHEFVVSPRGNADLAVRHIRSMDEMRDLVLAVPDMTGKSLTALTGAAGLSLSILTWANQPKKQRDVSIQTILTLLAHSGFDVFLRKRAPKKVARRQAMTRS